MSPHSLPCPWCAAPLRVQDRALVGRVFSCPDCRASIQVVEEGAEGFAIRRAGLSAAAEAPASSRSSVPHSSREGARKEPAPRQQKNAAARPTGGKQLMTSIGSRCIHAIGMLRDPLVLSWTVAGVFTLVMVCLIKPWGRGEPTVADAALVAPEMPHQEPVKPEAVKLASQVDTVPPPTGAVLLPPEIAETEPIIPPRLEEHKPPVTVVEQTRSPVVAAQPVSIALETSTDTSPGAKPVDIAALLEQPIRRYELTKAVPLSNLLPELRELAAVPIFADAAAQPGLADRLARPITLKLENTTVGEILRALAKQAGLIMEIRPDGVHLGVELQDAPVPKK